MSKIPIRILAIIFMIPIVLFGIGIAIVWNVYLLTNSIVRDIKRKSKKRVK
jgi:predicted membrane protein